jgi:ribosomal-protein-alanine N-acetyltransferase
MRHDDVAAVASIEAVAFSDPWPASAFAELIGQPHARLRVAVDPAGAVLGYCAMLHVLDEAELANIATHARARRRGVAGRLLDVALADADRHGTSAVFLEVRESNTAARALYGARGFKPVGRRNGYYQRPDEDALVLRRDRAHATGAPERP